MTTGMLFSLLDQLLFQIVWIGNHFAGGDLLFTSGLKITGISWRHASHCFLRAFADCMRALGSRRFQLLQATPKSQCIELTDREHTNAALRASGAAGQPLPASTARISKCRIHNLHQLLIARKWKATHMLSIAHVVVSMPSTAPLMTPINILSWINLAASCTVLVLVLQRRRNPNNGSVLPTYGPADCIGPGSRTQKHTAAARPQSADASRTDEASVATQQRGRRVR